MDGLLHSVQRRWPFAPVAVVYVVGLTLVANFAFGAAFTMSGPFGHPPRTTMYRNALTVTAPVDVQQIAQSVTEANGGPPTIGQPRPAETSAAAPPIAQAAAAPVTHLPSAALKPIAPTGPRPKVSTLPIATLLTLFQAYLASHPQAARHSEDS